MANQKKNNISDLNNHYINLAFELAKINLGSTKENPSVGCVVVKDNSVISSGFTSLNGRPHAEYNALSKRISYKNASIYISLEPCSHFGKTPPCTNLIIKSGIKKVYYSVDDIDLRSKNKSKKILNLKNITVKKNLLKIKAHRFYKSYYDYKKKDEPTIDGKIALSKDYFSISKKKNNKWITNQYSRKLTHLLRSKYNLIVSTSKSINKDNSSLNCRIDGLSTKSPDLAIIDRNLKIKKNLNIFDKGIKRKIYLFTTKKNSNKIKWLKNKNIKIILINKLYSQQDYKKVFKLLLFKGYSRIFVESGLSFTNYLIKNKLLNNIYIFKSNNKLNKYGYNNASSKIIKKIKLRNKLKTFLYEDKVYKEKLK